MAGDVEKPGMARALLHRAFLNEREVSPFVWADELDGVVAVRTEGGALRELRGVVTTRPAEKAV